MASTRSVRASGSAPVDALLGSTAWSGELTYNYKKFLPTDSSVSADLDPVSGDLRSAVDAAFAAVEDFTNLQITRVKSSHPSDIRVAQYDSAAAPGVAFSHAGAFAFLPGAGPDSGDVYVSGTIADELGRSGYAQRVVLHEVGHALGLKHPHEWGPFTPLPADEDSAEASVMSARGYPGAPLVGLGIELGGYSTSFMVADIAALQHLYGADYSDRRNTTYVFDPLDRVMLQTIWDGGGNDTYDFSAYVTDLAVDLRPGHGSTTGQEPQLNRVEELSGLARPVYAEHAIHNAALHRGDWRSGIENARLGAGDDAARGNALANRLTGNAGADTLNGLEGHDRLLGGSGADRLIGEAGRDTLDGGSGGDLLEGGSGRDRLLGRAADDTLIGGVNSDQLFGGSGEDSLVGNEGNDRIEGGAGGDTLRGGNGDDRLRGEEGSDTLFGDAGRDRMAGGDGDDLIFGGAHWDTVDAGYGDDRVEGGTGKDDLRGRGGDDTLIGGAGFDHLHGGTGDDHLIGGASGDTLTGGLGRDVYTVGRGDGFDWIIDFSLSADRLDVADPALALLRAKQQGAHTYINLSASEGIRLSNTRADDLDLTHFI